MTREAVYRLGVRGLGPLIAFLVLGGPFAFVGFQTVHIQGERDEQGSVAIDFTREHFFGLLKIQRHIDGATGAGTILKTTSSSSRDFRGFYDYTTTGVIVSGKSGEVPLFAVTSDTNDEKKTELASRINRFIQFGDEAHYSETVSLSDVFGWIGLPVLLLGILGLPLWCKAFVVYLVKGELPTW